MDLIKSMRPYQDAAIKAMAASVAKGKRPVGVVFCGGGKSLIIAEIIRRILKKNASGRVLVLVDTKELVSQNYIEFCEFAGFELARQSGVYSAGLRKKDQGKQILFGSIQSYVKYAPDSGVFDFIIIDECHLVPTNDKSQYRRVLSLEQEKNPKVACMGFTGTPWRLDVGSITGGGVFDDIACNIGCAQLISEGYLAPLVTYSLANESKANLVDVEVKNGEFIEAQASKAFMYVLPAQVKEILKKGVDRKKWLIFCQSKEHATAMFDALAPHVEGGVGLVFGDSKDRDQTINAFKLGKLRALVNVQVLRKGFNCPDIDLVGLCFGTFSMSIYVQVPARGMRIAPGKKDCLVLDFGGNIERHGPIDNLNDDKKKDLNKEKQGAPMKQCPFCGDLVPLNGKECPVCGHAFNRNEGKNLTKHAQKGGILSSELEMVEIRWMAAAPWKTRAGVPCIVMDFYKNKRLLSSIHKEFLNFWNPNIYAVKKAWDSIALLTPFKNRDKVIPLLKGIDNAPQMATAINDLISESIIEVPSQIFLGVKKDNKYKTLIEIT